MRRLHEKHDGLILLLQLILQGLQASLVTKRKWHGCRRFEKFVLEGLDRKKRDIAIVEARLRTLDCDCDLL
jgi:hypothetical protein